MSRKSEDDKKKIYEIKRSGKNREAAQGKPFFFYGTTTAAAAIATKMEINTMLKKKKKSEKGGQMKIKKGWWTWT